MLKILVALKSGTLRVQSGFESCSQLLFRIRIGLRRIQMLPSVSEDPRGYKCGSGSKLAVVKSLTFYIYDLIGSACGTKVAV